MSELTAGMPDFSCTPAPNAQCLRKILRLMLQHRIPATPINYAIWYEVVTANNAKLNAALDVLLQENKPFDAETSLAVYKKYICSTALETFERINLQVQKIIAQASDTLKLTHTQAGQAQVKFQKNTTLLHELTDPSTLNDILQTIIEETALLAAVTQSMQVQLDSAYQQVEQMRRELSQARQAADTDALTGLLNRRALNQIFTNLINQQPKQVCALMIDIDHFKQVNDTFGHLVGDNVLKFVAELLKKRVHGQHQVARYGGEEMVILMPNTVLKVALAIAEAIREEMEHSLLKLKDSHELLGKVTLSIGVTELRVHDTLDSLIARADQALYQAKRTGRNKVVCSA